MKIFLFNLLSGKFKPGGTLFNTVLRFQVAVNRSVGGGGATAPNRKKVVFLLHTEMFSFNLHGSPALLSALIVLYFPEKIFSIPLELVEKMAKNKQKISKI